MDPQTVAAVVVTYNRKELLASCLQAILVQTRPVNRIIVVDNCSVDGTQEFLSERGYLSKPGVEYVRLLENTGSAGGWHTGMSLAYEEGHDWVWTVDDDGVPLADNLSRLLECPSHILLRGSVVISSEDPSGDRLAAALPGPSGFVHSLTALGSVGAKDGILEGHANPWNAVLFSREVFKRVGLPKKEFFYRFVETEYFLRAKRAGIPTGTVLTARVLHPPVRQHGKRIRLGLLTVTFPYHDDPFAFYLYVRNAAYTLLRYRGPFHKSFLKILAYPLIFPRRAVLSLRALCEGVVGRFLPPDRIRAVASRLCW